ncbi:hypothetical protein AYO41_04250 [Verrucomicrobia bacterium SCGC AG-212-E04]|nr:hypothetical protein AYO41_04250 [Verrucomicrobia bacterium SCGC AG-212-E04]
MALPLFTLLTPAQNLLPPGDFLSEAPHAKAKGGSEQLYRIPEGQIILTSWEGSLHSVIYQTPLREKDTIIARNTLLFQHYGEGKIWNQTLDNGFGRTYRREDMERFALWSYHMDFNTFGTMAFHAVMWR